MSKSYGKRFDTLGHQFPRTDSVSYRAEEPILSDSFESAKAGRVTIEVVPLVGGMPGTFRVDARYTITKTLRFRDTDQTAATSVVDSIFLRGKGAEAARAVARELAAGFRSGEIPPWPEDPT